jgi:O-antigen/teichoic acid export membrane protein
MTDPGQVSGTGRPQGGIGRAAAAGVMWTTLGGVFERLVGFLSLAVVVRLMTVEEAGIAMLAASVFDVILVVSSTGYGERIIQNPTIDRVLLGTVFWLQFAVCSAVAVVFYLLAGPVSVLFGEPRIVPLLQAMAVLIVTRALPIVPGALLARAMDYRRLTLATVITSLASAAAGISVALAGHPIWSLVAQFYASSIVYAVVAFALARWLPPLVFSPREAWRSITFGAPLLVAGSMTALSAQASTLMIGAFLPIDAVAFYRIASRLMEVMGQVLIIPFQRVLLTTFSALQPDRARIEEAFLGLMRALATISFAAYALVAAQGPAVMTILFGATWAGSGVILAILAAGVVGVIARTFVPPSLITVGRTRLVLLYTLVVTVALIGVVALASPHGVRAVAWAQAGLLIATLPLSLLAFRLAFSITPWKVLGCLPLPLLSALGGAVVSHLLARWLAGVLPALPLLVRVVAAGAAGAVAFAGVHFLLGPQRTRQTMLSLRKLIAR